MKLGRWSTTAGNNNAAPPDGWPEGQAPSTINDCARENMAAIRVAFSDLQFFDHDMTPTTINTTSFSVPGNQTSAIHAGRRLKLFDAQTLFATVSTASFTTVTTIHVETDNGETLTSSLSSFGISVLSNNSNGLPRNVNLSTSALAAATLSVSATATFASQVNISGGLSVSGTCVAPNTAKAFIRASIPLSFSASISVAASYNIASITRDTTASIRISFTDSFPDANLVPVITWQAGDAGGGIFVTDVRYLCLLSVGSTSVHLSAANNNNASTNISPLHINAVFYHL